MSKFFLSSLLAIGAFSLSALMIDSQGTVQLQLIPAANAVIGAPRTPLSVGGVARRSTRRAIYATNANQQQQAQQEQQAAQQQAASTLPKGTVVSALPQGCTSVTVEGVNLFNCAGVMYKPTFQSNNLVYVVM